MNERIKELALQAKEETDALYAKLTPQEFKDTYNQKFSELIVLECAKLVRKYNYECIRNDEPYGIASDDIMNHFGVTE